MCTHKGIPRFMSIYVLKPYEVHDRTHFEILQVPTLWAIEFHRYQLNLNKIDHLPGWYFEFLAIVKSSSNKPLG